VDRHREHLRRLALHDEALLEASAAHDETSEQCAALDERARALVRIAATIALDAAPSSFQSAVSHGLAVGVSADEIVATLEAVTPVTGATRVVQCAPKVALALGYDVDAALERHDR
jgi:alkylhydroperoxidase/carboxymuconolactone decarboxylase family protein YurZ